MSTTAEPPASDSPHGSATRTDSAEEVAVAASSSLLSWDDEFLFPDDAVRRELRGLATRLDSTEDVRLTVGDETIRLPDVVREGLTRVVAFLAQGSAVSIDPVDQYLTTQEAANRLGVSRPHLIRLLGDAGIPHVRAKGARTHRRVPLRALLKYQEQRMEAARKEVLEEHPLDLAQDDPPDILYRGAHMAVVVFAPAEAVVVGPRSVAQGAPSSRRSNSSTPS